MGALFENVYQMTKINPAQAGYGNTQAGLFSGFRVREAFRSRAECDEQLMFT